MDIRFGWFCYGMPRRTAALHIFALHCCTLWWLHFPGLQQPLAGHAKAKTALLTSQGVPMRALRPLSL